VSFVDARGVWHSVVVYASSVLEAAAAGVKQIRETEMIEYEGVLDLTVDVVIWVKDSFTLGRSP
jgi:hypothetical protein